MSQPDRTETERMQREAEQRMREMQRRADRAVHGSNMPPVPNFVRTNMNRNSPTENSQKKPHENNNPTPSKQKSNKGFDILKLLNFKNLKIDNDIIIILMLIFLLSTEDTDELMLLALIYIML